MSNSTSALLTSTSPLFDRGYCDQRLAGSVVPRDRLTADDRNEMYELLESYFAATTRVQFESDLAEKEAVVLLRDVDGGQIRGFSTFMRISAMIDGQEVVAFFSGDTIVAHQFWSETVLSRLWSRTVFAEADRIIAARPATRVYWFLICSGYKTWRFLPVFFREFYPNADTPTPPAVRRILNGLGQLKFGEQYDARSGVVRFPCATPLRRGVADVTKQRLNDPRVEFFARMNPGHANGDELACLTEIKRSNLTRAGERMVIDRTRLD
jgi:hypothetical protein